MCEQTNRKSKPKGDSFTEILPSTTYLMALYHHDWWNRTGRAPSWKHSSSLALSYCRVFLEFSLKTKNNGKIAFILSNLKLQLPEGFCHLPTTSRQRTNHLLPHQQGCQEGTYAREKRFDMRVQLRATSQVQRNEPIKKLRTEALKFKKVSYARSTNMLGVKHTSCSLWRIAFARARHDTNICL